MTQITVQQMNAAKRVAQIIQPLIVKKERLLAQIEKLNEEIKNLDGLIDIQQGYVKIFAGGLTTEELIIREEGKYKANPAVVRFNEDKRVYVVIESESIEEETEEVKGADAAAYEEGMGDMEEQPANENFTQQEETVDAPVGEKENQEPEKEFDPFAPQD